MEVAITMPLNAIPMECGLNRCRFAFGQWDLITDCPARQKAALCYLPFRVDNLRGVLPFLFSHCA
jgi:hypothetical protein